MPRYGDTTPAPLSARETAEAIIKDADIDGVKREGEEMLERANQLRRDAEHEALEAAKETLKAEGEEEVSVDEDNAIPRFSVSERDHNGLPMVLSSDGTTTFGDIPAESGLQAAPIKLSKGRITNPKTNAGYGLVHIEARHGNKIRKAGYNSVVDFVEDVARHWENIKKGNMRAGNQTYLLEIPAKNENNSLFIELSKDGDYWNVNTAGVFRTSYSKDKKEVYNRHAPIKQPTETVGVAQDAEQSGTLTASSANAPTTSESKGSENSENARENAENLQGEGEFNTSEGEARFSAEEEAPANEDLFARAERIADEYQRQREQQREEATLKWYLTGNIRIPEDMPNVLQAARNLLRLFNIAVWSKNATLRYESKHYL